MKQHAIFTISLQWEKDSQRMMTPQMARDKLLIPIQEMWIMHMIDKFSIEETRKPRALSSLKRGNTESRRSFYQDPPVKKLRRQAK